MNVGKQKVFTICNQYPKPLNNQRPEITEHKQPMNLGEEVENDTRIESQSFQFQGSFVGLDC